MTNEPLELKNLEVEYAVDVFPKIGKACLQALRREGEAKLTEEHEAPVRELLAECRKEALKYRKGECTKILQGVDRDGITLEEFQARAQHLRMVLDPDGTFLPKKT